MDSVLYVVLHILQTHHWENKALFSLGRCCEAFCMVMSFVIRQAMTKLDGVGPSDNRPSTDSVATYEARTAPQLHQGTQLPADLLASPLQTVILGQRI